MESQGYEENVGDSVFEKDRLMANVTLKCHWRNKGLMQKSMLGYPCGNQEAQRKLG